MITAFTSLGLEYALRLRQARSPGQAMGVYLWMGREFCRRVNAGSWGMAEAVFTFNSAGKEILELARTRGLKAITEQCSSPIMVEQRIMDEEHDYHPGWEERRVNRSVLELADREQAEWEMADLILCGSDFVRKGMQSISGAAEKCVVAPYGVDIRLPDGANQDGNPHFPHDDKKTLNHIPGSDSRLAALAVHRPVRVLTVGTVGLQKGCAYLFDAAKRLGEYAHFRWVGGIELLPEATYRIRTHVELTGAVPRSEVQQHFAWADVFLLPSLCEGSATVTYEALAHGLPVICTPNTGSVVRDGIEGFIVPIRDSKSIAECVERLAADSELLARTSRNAKKRATEFTVAAYSGRLTTALNTL